MFDLRISVLWCFIGPFISIGSFSSLLLLLLDFTSHGVFFAFMSQMTWAGPQLASAMLSRNSTSLEDFALGYMYISVRETSSIPTISIWLFYVVTFAATLYFSARFINTVTQLNQRLHPLSAEFRTRPATISSRSASYSLMYMPLRKNMLKFPKM